MRTVVLMAMLVLLMLLMLRVADDA